MGRGADWRIKSSQRLYKDGNNRKVRNGPMSITAGRYVYIDRPPPTSSAAEELTTESYNQTDAHYAGYIQNSRGIVKTSNSR